MQVTRGSQWRQLLLLLLLLPAIANCAPPSKAKVFGPCVGMDCLHGVLMHGDAKHGDAHRVEDAEKRRERLDAMSADKSKPAQMDQEQYMHGVLMHGDAKPGESHRHEKSATVERKPEPSGPIDQEQYMHGVLMHGDARPGSHHEADHRHLRATAKAASRGIPGVEGRPRQYQKEADLLKAMTAGQLTQKAADESQSQPGLLVRLWRLLTGADSPTNEQKEEPKDFSATRDIRVVGRAGRVSEFESGDSGAGERRRERERQEHRRQMHTEH